MHEAKVRDIATAALEEIKAEAVVALDVSDKTSITDWMLIASGTSDRHVRALADNVVKRAKENGVRPLGIEGERGAEWVLVDLGEVIVHVMLPQAREHYQLEKLWTAELGEVADAGEPPAGLPRRGRAS